MIGNGDCQPNHWRSNRGDPSPPFASAHAVPGQRGDRDAGGGDETGGGHMQMSDVMHDGGIYGIQIVARDPVERVHAQLKSAS
jgi:hypothetical protein